MTSHDRLPHCDTENWYLAVGRDAAEELLAGKPQGTFLIRPSSDGQHALSIMCSGRVGHCKIVQVRRLIRTLTFMLTLSQFVPLLLVPVTTGPPCID